jgi:hypothetical protein
LLGSRAPLHYRGAVKRALALAAALGLVALAGVSVASTGATHPRIVIDRSIGPVSIGMTRTAVEAALGKPRSTLVVELGQGQTGLLVRYLRGALLVTYDGTAHVAAIETSSPRYRTADGIGPGTSDAGLAGLPHFHTDFCSLGVSDAARNASADTIVTVFVIAGGSVDSVRITKRALEDECPLTGGETQVIPPSVTLHADSDPGGRGAVVSSPPGIDCTDECDATFPFGTVVTLTPQPLAGFFFRGWEDDCGGTGGCTVTMDGDKKVTAIFLTG